MIRRHFKKLVIVVLLITLGLVLEIAGLLDAWQLLTIAREYAQHWWLIPLLILAQTILFTFALAGSVFLWIVAPLYDPAMATFILAAGGALGALNGRTTKQSGLRACLDVVSNPSDYVFRRRARCKNL